MPVSDFPPAVPRFVPVRTARSVPASASATRFLRRHLVLPVLALAALAYVGLGLGGDQWLADRLFAWEGGRWALKQAFLTDRLVHNVGKQIVAAAWLGVLLMWLLSWVQLGMERWRRPLLYLVLSTAVGILAVGAVKAGSNMDCPWDLYRYGGDRPYFGLFATRPPGLPRGACFPAGHASGGYAWMSLYFFFLAVRPRWRWAGLAAGIGMGLVFGVAQQLRGAHFFSHDVWTAAICWLTALALYMLLLYRTHGAGAADTAVAGAVRAGASPQSAGSPAPGRSSDTAWMAE